MPEFLCPTVVGREEELRQLRSAVDALAEGRGTTLVIVGEAGVGKSRLARQIAAEATDRRAEVLTGRAVERERPLAFRPITEALFSHLRRSGPPDVPELVAVRPLLGRLVPQWHLPGESPGEATLVVVGEALLRLLTAIGSDAGCVLVLEDLQWADGETLEVLEYLADNIASLPILVVVTLRSEPPSDALSSVRDLGARRAASLVELRRLTDEEVVSVAAGCLRSRDLPPALADALIASADGLPFLVEELLAAMVQAGSLSASGEGWVFEEPKEPTVPATFADTVRRRLEGAPELADVLGAAALLGRTFDWRLLAAMTGHDEAAIVDRLGRAVALQLVSAEASDAEPGFSFRHTLTREVVLAGLLPPRRALLAGRGLGAMESVHPGLPGEWCEAAAELAEAAGESRRAAELFLESGRRAIERGALATAEATLERARASALDDRPLIAEIDEVLCEALAATGSSRRVDEVGRRLLDELAGLDVPPARQARAHLWLARAAVVSADWEVARSHLEEAGELIEPTDRTRGDLQVLTARVALGEGRLDEAVTVARTALSAAEADGRTELACEALEVLGQRERQRDLDAAERVFTRVLALAEERDLRLWRIRALHELGTIDLLGGGPLDRLTRARAAALDAGALATAATVSLQTAAWFHNHAEPEPLLESARSCAAEAARLRLSLVCGLGFAFEAVGHAFLDHPGEMEAAIERALTASAHHPEVRGIVALQARALRSLIREDRRQALDELDTGMDVLRGTPVTAPHRGLWAFLHALDRDDGAAAVAEVEASGLTVYWLIRGWVNHARAVLLGREGRRAEAEEAFAVADADLAPCEWYRHHARRLTAEAALADGWGEPTRWLTDALAFFEPVGPPAVASACRSLLRRAGAPVPRRRRPAPGLPAPLAEAGVTARESEVLALLAEACPTKEIAARLYVSPKTVERHVSNLATKLGLSGRDELIAFAARISPITD